MPERGAGRGAEPVVAALQQAEHIDERAVRDQPAGVAQPRIAEAQRVTVERHFLCRRRLRIAGKEVGLKQLILRGDDVLDFRRSLRLLQGERVDQDALVGNGRRAALQFGECPVRGGQRFQHRDGFEVGAGWQGWDGVAWL